MGKTPQQLREWVRAHRKYPGTSFPFEVEENGLHIKPEHGHLFTVNGRPVNDKVEPPKAPALAPCPFCGARQATFFSFVLTLAFWRAGFYVECWKCGARGPSRVTKQRASDGWNYRAAAQKGGA